MLQQASRTAQVATVELGLTEDAFPDPDLVPRLEVPLLLGFHAAVADHLSVRAVYQKEQLLARRRVNCWRGKDAIVEPLSDPPEIRLPRLEAPPETSHAAMVSGSGRPVANN